MSKKCELTGISPLKGHNVSHAKNKTKRRFLPNLKKVTFRSDILKKNIKLSEITSPTFSILNEYEIKDIKIRHYDLFRIKNSEEIKNIGMFENTENFLTFVEWPEKIKKKIGNNYNLFFKYNFKSEKRFLEFRNKKKGHIFNVKNKP